MGGDEGIDGIIKEDVLGLDVIYIQAKKWEGSVKDGIEHLRSYEQIVIHPRCTDAQMQARLWRYKTDPRTNDVLPILKEGNDHIWDAVRYGLQPIIKRRPGPTFRVVGEAA